jgi:hypothetical protein
VLTHHRDIAILDGLGEFDRPGIVTFFGGHILYRLAKRPPDFTNTRNVG